MGSDLQECTLNRLYLSKVAKKNRSSSLCRVACAQNGAALEFVPEDLKED